MNIGYVGLGKMGKNMVLRLLEKKHQVVAWNRSAAPGIEVAAAGAIVVDSLKDLVTSLPTPRVIWLMLPAGEVTERYVLELIPLLSKGDTVIDGANSFYLDTKRRAEMLAKNHINFMDSGTSGGPVGARNGACLMIGGQLSDYTKLEQLFTDFAAPGALQFFAGHGAGHFVKMIHNGIEYGMMQAIAEGFAVMNESDYNLDLEKVAHMYQQHSVIESRLVGWAEQGFKEYGSDLREITSTIDHTGEGEWTIKTAKKLHVPVPIIEGSFQFRLDSASQPSFTGKVVSMLRGQFGGHAVK